MLFNDDEKPTEETEKSITSEDSVKDNEKVEVPIKTKESTDSEVVLGYDEPKNTENSTKTDNTDNGKDSDAATVQEAAVWQDENAESGTATAEKSAVSEDGDAESGTPKVEDSAGASENDNIGSNAEALNGAGVVPQDDSSEGKTDSDDNEHIPEDNGDDLPNAEGKKNKKTEKVSIIGNIYSVVEMVAISLAIVIFIITFLFRYSKVDGSSMTYTIDDGDSVFVNIIGYKPKSGDIVVLQAPDYNLDKPLIKRVIAVEGDTLEIDFDSWRVSVNGYSLQETYVRYNPYGLKEDNDSFREENPNIGMYFDHSITEIPGGSFDEETHIFKLTIPEDKIFVMGDNRNNSHDSRASNVGLINEECVVGKAVFRLYPFSKIGAIE